MPSAGKFTLIVVLTVLLVFLLLTGSEIRQGAFTYAACHSHTRTMKILVLLGADANKSIEPTIHPLLCATYNNDAEAVRFLLEHGADVNAKEPLGWTALMVAAQQGNSEIVRLLWAKGINVNAVGDEGSALYLAMKRGNAEIIDILKKSGAKECKSHEYDRCF